jgi:hypothetical protein
MSDNRKAAIVCWTIAGFKVAGVLLVFAIVLLLLALAGAADNAGAH